MNIIDINEVSEVYLNFKNGKRVIYRGTGLEKFRRGILASPPLEESGYQKVIIDEDDDFLFPKDRGSSPPKEDKTRRIHAGRGEPTRGILNTGFGYEDFPSKGVLKPRFGHADCSREEVKATTRILNTGFGYAGPVEDQLGDAMEHGIEFGPFPMKRSNWHRV